MAKRSFRSLVSQFFKQESGNIAIMTAISGLVLMGVMAVAVDTSMGVRSKSNLQDTSDAAALMIAKSDMRSRSEMIAAAQAFLDVNYSATEQHTVHVVDVIRDGDSVTVKLAGDTKTSFAGSFGRKALDIGTQSTAVYSKKAIDIALVLDTTGSMGRASGTPGVTKLAALKRSANSMVDTISTSGNGDMRVSVVPFAAYVNVGTDQASQSWLQPVSGTWNGCVGNRRAPFDEQARLNSNRVPAISGSGCATAVQPLTSDLENVSASINGLNASGWTYLPTGLVWGWRTLHTGQPFAHRAEPETQKIMVVMTDGENTCRTDGTYNVCGVASGPANQKTRKLCQSIKNDDITVYTIAFGIGDSTTRSILRNCASSADKYFDARNAEQLDAAFAEIGAELSRLRVSA